MQPQGGRRTQGTFTHKRMVWPYVLTTREDGSREVEVRDAICPRCRGKASYKQSGDRVLLSCSRCNISESYHPYRSYEELREAVGKMVLGSMA